MYAGIMLATLISLDELCLSKENMKDNKRKQKCAYILHEGLKCAYIIHEGLHTRLPEM